ncbi:hypothetical protein E2562_034737 [Oryza meyeriana var. granulata]|uniref:Retrotransposon gag domain-containing protein n=1 Tax=Oryza meyeriana var. granulata TaxID=110450 RepID=A0A6G1BQ83_9ORYZ|nr:hypothetical protein E2562_034737 [Oryza meyeriana var. granulata]
MATLNQLMQTFLNLFGPNAQGGPAAHGGSAAQVGQAAQANHNQSTYREFMRTKPPVFLEATEPLKAEDWLCLIEKEMGLIHATNENKVWFTTSQLDGPANDWWESYQAS